MRSSPGSCSWATEASVRSTVVGDRVRWRLNRTGLRRRRGIGVHSLRVVLGGAARRGTETLPFATLDLGAGVVVVVSSAAVSTQPAPGVASDLDLRFVSIRGVDAGKLAVFGQATRGRIVDNLQARRCPGSVLVAVPGAGGADKRDVVVLYGV